MRNRKAQRGSTIIEVMFAAAILLVAIVGLVAVMNTAATATAFGHRRTVGAHIRQAVIDRVMVTPRDRIDVVYPHDEWLVDACYDVDSRELATNAARATTFECPERTTYRTWFRIEPQAGQVRLWRVLTYAERLDGAAAGCSADQRYSSRNCLGTDLLLTD